MDLGIKLNKFILYMDKHARKVKYPYSIFGVFGIISYPLYYLLWIYASPQGYESILIRSIAVLLCIPLALSKYWKEKYLKYLPIYWYITILYCIPFFFSYMTVANNFSYGWELNSLTGVVLFILLIDMIPLLIILPVGVSLGYLVYIYLNDSVIFVSNFSISSMIITYFAVIVFGVLFARKKQVLHDKDLIESKKKAESASAAKTEFIANMSHDLRTPMTGLLGMLDGLLYAAEDTRTSLSTKASSNSPNVKLLLNDMLGKVEEYAGMARVSANKLNQLHNDILDNIELETGESKEVDTPFNLDQLTQTIVGLQKPVAVNKGLELSAEIESGMPCYLKGLYQSLTRILLNLVGNAIKFTKAGSVSIVIGLDEDEEGFHAGDEINLKIQVKDTGTGIPSDKFDEIFGQFSRLTASYEGTHKGLGLGLYVVKEYLDQMKGTISIESKVGEGSCFTLYVPLIIEKEGVAQTRELINEKEPKAEVADEKTITEGLSVLLVEDDKIAATATRMNLVRLGCDVDWVESGEAALEKVAGNNYRLIFMDIGLPNKSGIDITAEIRDLADKQKATIPIIALTGHARGKIRKLCLDVGMQKVLSKPVHIAELERVLLYFAVN